MKINFNYLATLCVALLLSALAMLWPKPQVKQTVDCVDKNNCRPSYNNSAICRDIPTGANERELFVQLGMPISIKGFSLYFEQSPSEKGPILIELDENRRAKLFLCSGAT
jgi:hypothetical protein